MAQSMLENYIEKTTKGSESPSENTFHYKLFSILENEEYHDIISWDLEGLRIEIKHRKKLEEKVLPVVFSHSKLASFFRQLNYYGFKCCKDAVGSRTYSHPYFQKGNKALLSKMIRSKPHSSKSKAKEEESQAGSLLACSLKYKTHDLMDELTLAYHILEQLRVENQYLRCQLEKARCNDFSYREWEISKRHFGEAGSFRALPVSQASSLEGSAQYQPNERTFYSFSNNAQAEQPEPCVQGFPNLSCNYDSQYADQFEERTSFHNDLRNYF